MLFVLLCAFVIVAFVPTVWWCFNLRKYSYIEKIPGPPLVPVFGNIFEFGSNIVDHLSNLTRLTQKYGPIVRMWLGPFGLRVIISDPKYVEFFLTSNVHITKSSGYDLFQDWLGKGLITSSGDYWRRHRKIIEPAFHYKLIEQFSEVFNSAGNVLVEKFTRQISESSVDIFPLVNFYALDVICETSMGVKINAQQNQNKEYVDAVVDYMQLVMIKTFSIIRRWHFYYRSTEEYRKEQKNLKILKTMSRTVIDNRKREMQSNISNKDKSDEFGVKTKKALLDKMLNLQNEDAFTDEELNDEVNTFLVAGHDTISTTLCFCLFQVAKYPEMQSIIFDEIVSVVGKDKNKPVTMKHAQELKYLERFIKEVFRVYTPVPYIERVINEDIKIDQYKLPKGTLIMICPYAMHASEKYFPNPEKFDPDRFLPENIVSINKFAYIPFAAGPRNCVGQRFAMIQLKITIANILRSLELLPVVPEHKFVLGNKAVLKAMNGVPIRFKIRE